MILLTLLVLHTLFFRPRVVFYKYSFCCEGRRSCFSLISSFQTGIWSAKSFEERCIGWLWYIFLSVVLFFLSGFCQFVMDVVAHLITLNNLDSPGTQVILQILQASRSNIRKEINMQYYSLGFFCNVPDSDSWHHDTIWGSSFILCADVLL